MSIPHTPDQGYRYLETRAKAPELLSPSES
jgi:hypothetical protein